MASTKIIKLTVENFMKLRAVEITPDGNIVMITGANEQGKSSVLDAIEAALCGKKYHPEKPIHKDADYAEVKVETNNWIVKRTWDEKGSKLTITNSENEVASSPQTLLNKIVGEIAFDPTRFMAFDDRKQREVLMDLLKLDFSDIDKTLADLKTGRTHAKKLKGLYTHDAEKIVIDKTVPAEEVSLEEIIAKMQKAIDLNAEQDNLLHDAASLGTDIERYGELIEQGNREIGQLEESLVGAKKRQANLKKQQEESFAESEAISTKLEPRIATEIIQEEIDGVEATNKLVREAVDKKALYAKAREQTNIFARLGQEMKDAEAEKAERLSKVEMPIEGLSVSEDGLLYNDIPLKQECQSKRLRISTAIAIKMNPTLRVIRMDGNGLDTKSLAEVAKMAEEADCQIWIEKVDETGKVGIVIEDGLVKANEH